MEKQELIKYQELAAELQDLKQRLIAVRARRENGSLIYEQMIEKKQEELAQELVRLETYIEEIPESGLRLLFRYYFIDGKTQSEIAELLHTDRSVISRRIQSCLTVNSTQKHKKKPYNDSTGVRKEE